MLGHTFRHRLDHFGATGSLLCAAHCVVLPLLLVIAPTSWSLLWFGDEIEQVIVLSVTLLGLFSLLMSYFRHRAWRAIGILFLGLTMLWLVIIYKPLHYAPTMHALTMAIGGTLVGIAHMINLRLNHRHIDHAGSEH
ncbi:MAG TPA: MerC domain-containing protein [Xylella sp.]